MRGHGVLNVRTYSVRLFAGCETEWSAMTSRYLSSLPPITEATIFIPIPLLRDSVFFSQTPPLQTHLR